MLEAAYGALEGLNKQAFMTELVCFVFVFCFIRVRSWIYDCDQSQQKRSAIEFQVAEANILQSAEHEVFIF